MTTTSLHIQASLPGESGFDLFTAFPQRLYSAKNLQLRAGADTVDLAALHACYLASADNQAVGRFSLYYSPSLVYKGVKNAYIGHYECVEDPAISHELLQFAKQKAAALGADYLIGPMNGSSWHTYRFADDHDQPQFFTETYHHLYYHAQFKQLGFEKIAHYESHIKHSLKVDEQLYQKLEAHLTQAGVRIRQINMDQLEDEMYRVCAFCLKAFQSNFLFTAIEPKVFVKKYCAMAPWMNPAFILFAENEAGELLGLMLCFENHYAQDHRQLILKTVARSADPAYRGLGTFLQLSTIKAAEKAGIKSTIHAFMAQQNASKRISDELGYKPYRTYSLYGVGLREGMKEWS